MKHIFCVIMIVGLAACGRPERFETRPAVALPPAPVATPQPAAAASVSAPTPPPKPVAVGPISRACLSSGRQARSRELCGCIQHAANETLSPSQQSRAVTFYANPAAAQTIRQSDRPGDERFWDAYRAYEERAELICR